MKVPELGCGIVFGVGGTNYREGLCDAEGNVGEILVDSTPSTPQEFFAKTGRRILIGADKGASYAVLGVPGPVAVAVNYQTGEVDQNVRVTNIPALSLKKGFDPVAEMINADPAMRELLEPDSGFTFLAVKDGDLAVQAAARFYGTTANRKYNVVGDVILGTGNGSAVARRDPRFPDRNLFHPDPGLWEVGHPPILPGYTSLTYEATIAGPALEKRLGKRGDEISDTHPIWHEVGVGLGVQALNLALYGGTELVVLSGGVGIHRQGSYADDLKRYLETFANSANPMADKVPDIKFAPPEMADTYELYGAHGAVVSHLTRIAIGRMVAA